MKKVIYILVFLLVLNIVIAEETQDYTELKTLVREGDSAIMAAINENNADCVAKVDARYNEFIGGIEQRFVGALFVERVVLMIGLVFSLLLFWGLKKLLDIWVNRIIGKRFLLKMQNIENMIQGAWDFIKKNDIKKAREKYKQIRKIYIKISKEGKTYIYQKVLDLQKELMRHGN